MPRQCLAQRQSHQVPRRLHCPPRAPRKGRGLSGDLRLLGPSPASSHRVLVSGPRPCPAVPGAEDTRAHVTNTSPSSVTPHDSRGTPWREHHDQPRCTSHGTGLSGAAALPYRWPSLLPGTKRSFLGHCNINQVAKELCFRLHQPVPAEKPPKPTT